MRLDVHDRAAAVDAHRAFRGAPAGRWGRVHELVGALVFLSSGASDFVNGQTIYVDGGMTAVV